MKDADLGVQKVGRGLHKKVGSRRRGAGEGRQRRRYMEVREGRTDTG